MRLNRVHLPVLDLDTGPGAMVELGRDRGKAEIGEAARDVADVIVDAKRFLENEDPRPVRDRRRRTGDMCDHRRPVTDF